MDRRMFLGILAGSLLAAPLAAAETPGPPPGDRVLIVDTHVHPLRSLHRGGFAVSASIFAVGSARFPVVRKCAIWSWSRSSP
jgi:hypothetical protein